MYRFVPMCSTLTLGCLINAPYPFINLGKLVSCHVMILNLDFVVKLARIMNDYAKELLSYLIEL